MIVANRVATMVGPLIEIWICVCIGIREKRIEIRIGICVPHVGVKALQYSFDKIECRYGTICYHREVILVMSVASILRARNIYDIGYEWRDKRTLTPEYGAAARDRRPHHRAHEYRALRNGSLGHAYSLACEMLRCEHYLDFTRIFDIMNAVCPPKLQWFEPSQFANDRIRIAADTFHPYLPAYDHPAAQAIQEFAATLVCLSRGYRARHEIGLWWRPHPAAESPLMAIRGILNHTPVDLTGGMKLVCRGYTKPGYRYRNIARLAISALVEQYYMSRDELCNIMPQHRYTYLMRFAPNVADATERELRWMLNYAYDPKHGLVDITPDMHSDIAELFGVACPDEFIVTMACISMGMFPQVAGPPTKISAAIAGWRRTIHPLVWADKHNLTTTALQHRNRLRSLARCK